MAQPPEKPKPGQQTGSWASLFGHGDKTEEVRPSYGFTADDPILCNEFAGSFIGSLRCPAGHHLRGRRLGSMDGKCSDLSTHVEPMRDLMAARFPEFAGPKDKCIVDRYDLQCDGGEYSCSLFFDIYHPDLPPQPAPAGLSKVATAD
jgi:hypothetical protein